MRSYRPLLALGLAAAAAVQLVEVRQARACGCLSPPAVTEGDYAIAQASEQIIFEVTPGWVTAHVLIRYAGDPAQFAWLVPVPEVPDLSISPVSAFGLLDAATAPQVSVTPSDVCPVSEWACHYDYPESSGGGCLGGTEQAGLASTDAGTFGTSDAAAGGAPPVTVINTQTVGDYQTVTFAASNAIGATQWLHDNGFIVNDTTSIYMESYIQANMVFVAAKLVPGAPSTAIKPLRLHYRAAYPTIPLILTAVAAQPHLTVTAFVYADQPYRPMGHPVVTIAPDRLARDGKGRFNYPMVLARTIDEAGGDAFAVEYRGSSSPSQVGTGSCCGGGGDYCGIGNDGQCECPADEFDASDCAEQGDLVDGVRLLRALGGTYASLTRITTRISPEEMTFDPGFEPDPAAVASGPMYVASTQPSLASCIQAVRDRAAYADITAEQGCNAMYCGPTSECVITQAGPACACGSATVATGFIDLDEHASVTCVPAVPPVDLRAGGDLLTDACWAVDCGTGQCEDRNGVAVCRCDASSAAVLGSTAGAPPRCSPIRLQTHSPGAQDFALPLAALAVCAPAPPLCGTDGYLEHVSSPRVGVDCGNATPPESLTTRTDGCGCQESGGPSPAAFVGAAWFGLVVLVRRRRRGRA